MIKTTLMNFYEVGHLPLVGCMYIRPCMQIASDWVGAPGNHILSVLIFKYLSNSVLGVCQ